MGSSKGVIGSADYPWCGQEAGFDLLHTGQQDGADKLLCALPSFAFPRVTSSGVRGAANLLKGNWRKWPWCITWESTDDEQELGTLGILGWARTLDGSIGDERIHCWTRPKARKPESQHPWVGPPGVSRDLLLYINSPLGKAGSTG